MKEALKSPLFEASPSERLPCLSASAPGGSLGFCGRAEFVFWPFPGSFFGFTVLGDAKAAEWLRDQREGSTVEA